MNLIQDVENLLHPIKEAVDAAVSKAHAAFEADKAVIAGDIRAAVSAAVSAVQAAEPALIADAEAAAKAVEAAVEAALAAHGL